MPSDLQGKIEQSLHDIRYHPDFAKEADDRLQELLENCKTSERLESMMQEIRCQGYDAILMQEKYFPARVAFLTRLISYLDERPESNLSVAEDGCGTGVDLHVLNALLTDKVTLTGIDANEVALARAQKRVPHARFMTDFQDATFDVIYADFVSIDDNSPWAVAARGAKVSDALRSPGVVLQNSDAKMLNMYCMFFGQKFSKIIRPELLAKIQNGPDCYLCRFEKE